MSHKHFWTLLKKKQKTKQLNNNPCDFLQSETINQENNRSIFPVIIITSDRALSPQRKTNDDLQWLNAHVGVSVETWRKELKMLRGARRGSQNNRSKERGVRRRIAMLGISNQKEDQRGIFWDVAVRCQADITDQRLWWQRAAITVLHTAYKTLCWCMHTLLFLFIFYSCRKRSGSTLTY